MCTVVGRTGFCLFVNGLGRMVSGGMLRTNGKEGEKGSTTRLTMGHASAVVYKLKSPKALSASREDSL